MTPDKLRVARAMCAAREHTIAQIAEVLGVSRATVYRHLDPTPASEGPRVTAPPLGATKICSFGA